HDPGPSRRPSAPPARAVEAASSAYGWTAKRGRSGVGVVIAPGSDPDFGVRGVGEFAELAGDEVGGLFADVDGVVADAFEAAGDDEHAHAPFAVVAGELEDVVEGAAVAAVDQFVELDE